MSSVMDKPTSRQPLRDSSNYKNNSETTPSKSRTQLSVALQLLRTHHLKVYQQSEDPTQIYLRHLQDFTI